MASPSPSWNTVRVYATWRNQTGSLKAGKYKVTVPARITNATDDDIIPAGTFDQGILNVVVPSSPSLDVLVPSNNDPDNQQTGWKVVVEVTFDDGSTPERYVVDTPYADRPVDQGGTGAGVNLRNIAMSEQLPTQVALYRVGVPGGLAQLNLAGKVVNADGSVPAGVSGSGGSGGTGASTWDQISGKPATFAPAIGSTATTAVAGNDPRLTDARTPLAHTHLANDISDATLVGRNLFTAASAAAARTAIGAGTSSLALGSTSTTAKAGNYTPPIADLPPGSMVSSQGLTTRPTARPDIIVIFDCAADPGTNAFENDKWWH